MTTAIYYKVENSRKTDFRIGDMINFARENSLGIVGFDLAYDVDGAIAPIFRTHYQPQSTSSSVIQSELWNHIVIIYNGGDKNDISSYQLYSNGAPESLYFASYTLAGAGYSSNYIGREGNGMYFNGSIDEIRIYNRALTGTEVGYIYNEDKPVEN